LVCEAIGTAATPGVLCQPRVIVKMIVEKQMECRLAGETEDLSIYLSITLCWTLASLSVSQSIHIRYDSLAVDQPVARPLPRHTTTQIQYKRRQISVP
jgi:hypothetical protein